MICFMVFDGVQAAFQAVFKPPRRVAETVAFGAATAPGQVPTVLRDAPVPKTGVDSAGFDASFHG
jgi:hypothetical protein